MKDTKDVKERIIKATTELIEESGGDTAGITARKIAERAGVALGLINYHFGGKDNLINSCVQKIVNRMIMCFMPDNEGIEVPTDREQVAERAKRVMDFMFRYPAICSISVLEDLGSYKAKSNTVYTQKGFSMAISGKISEEDRRLLVFMLTAAIQAAFLSRSASKEVLGCDLTVKEERDGCIERMTRLLFEGV